jgi:hypothetical protein
MSRPLEHAIEFAAVGQNAVRTCAVTTFEPSDGATPYVREIATLRIHDASAMQLTLGTRVTLCGRSWTVYELKRRPERRWATAKVAHVMPEPSDGAYFGRSVVVMRPVHTVGLNAGTVDEVVFRNEAAVFAALPTRREAVESSQQTVGKAACYVSHQLGPAAAPGWSLWDGENRWRVDSIRDVARFDRLPMLEVTKTGNHQ